MPSNPRQRGQTWYTKGAVGKQEEGGKLITPLCSASKLRRTRTDVVKQHASKVSITWRHQTARGESRKPLEPDTL
jgi:hypothetical protein